MVLLNQYLGCVIKEYQEVTKRGYLRTLGGKEAKESLGSKLHKEGENKAVR